VIELVAEGYFFLIWTDLVLRLRNLRSLCSARPVQTPCRHRAHSVAQICRAMDLACVLYPKRVLCLQRSVATSLLLSRHGIAARLVIGVRLLPFKSHAWVEVNGAPVNDKPYMRQIYSVLEDPGNSESQR
jgi:hypothetical protein